MKKQEMDGMLNELFAGGAPQGAGMADDVVAQIDGERPARLSEGEFIIPADVVSMLGDGNTKAGSKVLQKLIEDIRSKKTGKTTQAAPMQELV